MNSASHIAEGELELYALGRLAPGGVDRLEDHLLECDSCREALDNTAVYHRAMRAELAKVPEFRPRSWFDWLRAPAFALAATAIVVVIAGWLFMTRFSVTQAPLAVIELVALRGDLPVSAQARETELRLRDIGDFQGAAEVVDENGGPVWKGPVAPGGLLRIKKSLKEGAYFVRVYQGTKLFHEYGFRVRPS